MSELAGLLKEAATRLFADHGRAAADALLKGWQSDLWREASGAGLHLTLVPEAQGGVGGGWEEAYGVLHPSGYYQMPLPLAENMLAAKLCADAGWELPEGLVSLSPYGHGSLQGGFTGQLRSVPWGRHADAVLTSLPTATGVTLLLLPRAAATLTQGANLAGEPRDHLEFHDCAPLAQAQTDAPAAVALFDHCTLLRLAQIAGALQSALGRSIFYAGERKQFGRPIGQFQAVQQQLALFGAEVAAVDCAVKAACRAATTGRAHFQIGAAKLRANQAIGFATASAHQVHGAIGFTMDHPLHHATQRLWSWRNEFGNDRYWSEELGGEIAARGADQFWSDLTARDDLVG